MTPASVGASNARPQRTPVRIPSGVWALGFVSLFMDISSEMIHALLPVFLVGVLGASVASVGLLEGTAEAIASITKLFSGTFSDWLGKRKALTVVGYGLAALTKPLFALAPSPGWVFTARSIDRVGKGIRGAPRDALLAELTSAPIRGAAFGLRQALDTVGAFVGPLAAIALMGATANAFRTVFWFAAIPAAIAVALLVLFVREPQRETARHDGARRNPLLLVGTLGAPFWWLVFVAALFTLARFSEAFLILKVAEVGIGVGYVPAVLVVMNVGYALSAYPAGWCSDRVNRWGVFALGAALLVAADVVLAFGASITSVGIGITLWGLHMGFTQGVLAALVTDASRAEQRGTAFAVFNLVTGLALLVASVLAGVLWDRSGSSLTFLAGAALTGVAGIVAVALHGLGKIDGRPRAAG